MSRLASLKRLGVMAGLGVAAASFAQTDAPVATTTTTTTTTTTPAPTHLDPAPVSMHEGWNTPWAFLFSINNVLSVANVITSPINGSIGGVYNLSHNKAIRAGISLGHTANPVTVTKVVTTAGNSSVATYTVTNPGGYTDTYNVTGRADYVMRLLDSPIAPYIGGGAQVGWGWTRQSYTDDKSVVDQTTRIDNHNSTFNVSARAIAGAEWRFHPGFAVYADYNVTVSIYNNNHISNTTLIQNTVGQVTSSVRSVTTQDVNTWLNVSAGVGQGAQLGLEVFF